MRPFVDRVRRPRVTSCETAAVEPRAPIVAWTGAVCTAVVLASIVALTGCAPAIIAVGVGGAAMVATDRRTAGTQVDDEGAELKIITRANELYDDKIHLNITCYNGMALLTGEVPDQGTWSSLGGLAKSTPKIRIVQNEMVVAPLSTLSSRTNDSYITSKVKSRFLEANKFSPNVVKVVTERGVVYLLGIVSRTEGDDAGNIAASTSDVVRVVKVFDYRP